MTVIEGLVAITLITGMMQFVHNPMHCYLKSHYKKTNSSKCDSASKTPFYTKFENNISIALFSSRQKATLMMSKPKQQHKSTLVATYRFFFQNG